ncbi:hypothetical protein CXB51_022469 [Gossypium anomalum]|uniref:Uncharacterized protein n=1 Tax=Gossypium anomalum TaxID=47600 RepID=A0A8J5Y7I6_9ROSI|nr:hypothetical protein CXB51_022469 [Gossypium anomalum]
METKSNDRLVEIEVDGYGVEENGLAPQRSKDVGSPSLFLDSTTPNGEESSDDAAAGWIWQSQRGRSLPFWCKRRQGSRASGIGCADEARGGVRRWEEIRVSKSTEIGLGFGPVGPSEIGFGLL